MKLLIFFAAGLLSIASFANPGDSTEIVMNQLKAIDSIESTFHYKTGKVVLKDGLATINIAPGFKFLEGADAKRVIEDVWGNLKSQTEPLGMIVPENAGASYSSYAFIVEYESIGYVKDQDADKINYEDLLKDMKKGTAESNAERRKAGLATMDLIGWAAKPYYDKNRKVLHWAKEIKVEGEEEHTLNYDIRILGRKGVLTLQAVASMSALDSVNQNINNILGMVNFNAGNQYIDFNSNTDEIAAWTIGGLVAGKVLAKVGFFAIILKYLKIILLGAAAAGSAIWRFITGKKKKQEEVAYETVPPTEEQS